MAEGRRREGKGRKEFGHIEYRVIEKKRACVKGNKLERR